MFMWQRLRLAVYKQWWQGSCNPTLQSQLETLLINGWLRTIAHAKRCPENSGFFSFYFHDWSLTLPFATPDVHTELFELHGVASQGTNSSRQREREKGSKATDARTQTPTVSVRRKPGKIHTEYNTSPQKRQRLIVCKREEDHLFPHVQIRKLLDSSPFHTHFIAKGLPTSGMLSLRFETTINFGFVGACRLIF